MPFAQTCLLGYRPWMIVAFDGVCVLCNGFVRFLLRRDRARVLQFATNQSQAGAALFARTGQASGAPASVVLEDNGRIYLESDAALRAIAALGGGWGAANAFQLVPRRIRDGVYRLVAHHRYRWFGRLDACPLPDPTWAERFLA